MRFRVVGNLKAHARAKGERAPVLELGAQFTLQAIQNVPLDAPVVCDIPGRTLDDPNADVAELPSPPDRFTGLARCSLGATSPHSVVTKGIPWIFIGISYYGLLRNLNCLSPVQRKIFLRGNATQVI